MFWKFNSFVAAVGTLLVIAAFLTGDHTLSITTPDHTSSAVWFARQPHVFYLAMASAVSLSWATVMTLLGLLASFFRPEE